MTGMPAIEPGTWRDNCSHCGGWKSTGCQHGCKYNQHIGPDMSYMAARNLDRAALTEETGGEK